MKTYTENQSYLHGIYLSKIKIIEYVKDNEFTLYTTSCPLQKAK